MIEESCPPGPAHTASAQEAWLMMKRYSSAAMLRNNKRFLTAMCVFLIVDCYCRYLKHYDKDHTEGFYRIVAERILSIDSRIKLPEWLIKQFKVNYFKGPFGSSFYY